MMVADAPSSPRDDTREQLLEAAHRQFADRGFYGASIAQIAGQVGLTKQALLYHFKRKEDLYAEVLKGIATRLLAAMRARAGSEKPARQRFEDVFVGLYEAAVANPLDTQVLMRELVDDQRHDAPEPEWFLKTFLEEIVSLLDTVEGQAELPHEVKFARLYTIMSAIQYFVASENTLRRFYGEQGYGAIATAYPVEIRAMVDRLLDGTAA